MSNKIIFNLFLDSKLDIVKKLSTYFNLPLEKIEEALSYGCSTASFINDLKINLTNYNSEKIVFVGRHITSANDESINSFKEKGLLDLRSSLPRS